MSNTYFHIQIRNQLIPYVKAWGKKVLELKRGALANSGKASKDVLTEADLYVDQAVRDFLQANCPDHSVVTEEGENIQRDSDYVWYIDPIDGTVNFSRHSDHFGISLGLCCKGQPVMGLIYFPSLDRVVSAVQGSGAYLDGHKIKVSNRSCPEEIIYATPDFNIGIDAATQAKQNKFVMELLQITASEVMRTRTYGAAIYDSHLVANGELEGYILNNFKPWDLAAVACIVIEAGGKVTDYQGQPIIWGQTKQAILSNGLLHDYFIKVCQQAQQKCS